MPPRQEIRLLGVFDATINDESVADRITPRAQSLLAYLILHRDAPQPRHYLAYLLWPDSNESQARTNLRKLIHQLRNALPGADEGLLATRTALQWLPDAPYDVDVVALDAALACAAENADRAEELPALRRAAELYRGDLLPDCYDDWIGPLRAEYADRMHTALSRLVERLEVQRAYADAVVYARRLIDVDPLDEGAVRQLLRLHLLDGNRTAALSAYQSFADELARELGVEPDAETVAIYERARAPSSPDDDRAASSQKNAEPLIARTREWQLLRAAWQQALHGNARLVAITGEAGIGKTRLGQELLDWAQRQGYRIARSRSYAAHGALAYAPIADLLREESLEAHLRKLDDVWLTEVSRLLPELLNERPGLPAPEPMAESWQRQRFFDALARAVRADDAPLAVQIDDLQWSDPDSLEWLAYLLHQHADSRLLVVGTVRTDEVDAKHPYEELALALSHADQLTEIPLRPLDVADTERLGEQVAGRALGDEDARQLYADTEGNPLFVIETLRAQISPHEDALPLVADPIGANALVARLPAKVYTVIRGRLAQLSPRAQELTSLAAVAGRSFTYELLQAATRQDALTLADGLEELLHRRILVERGADAYDFSHDRIRDVAYAEISRVRRRLLHEQVARTLLAVYGEKVDGVLGQLAEHFVQAGRKPEAVDYLVRAGDRSADQYANEEALACYARALELLPEDALERRYDILVRRLDVFVRTQEAARRLPEIDALASVIDQLGGADRESVRRRADLAIRRAQYAGQAGSSQEAIQYGEAALQLAQEAQDRNAEARAGFELGRSYWSLGEIHKAQELLQASLDLTNGQSQSHSHVRTIALLAATGMFSGMPAQEIKGYLEQSLAISERAGNIVGQADGYNKLGYLHVHGIEGAYETAREHYLRATRLGERSGSTFWIATSESNLGYLDILLGQYGEARLHLERALNLTREYSIYFREGAMRVYLGFLERSRGDYAAALAAQQSAIETLANVGLPLWGTWAHREMSLAYRALGDLERAETYARNAIKMVRTFGDTRQEGYALTALGLALEDQGRPDAADYFRDAIDCYRRMELFNRSMAPLAGLARLAAKAGDSEQACAYLEQMTNHLSTHELDKTEEGFRVYVTCYRLLQAAGDPRAADFLAIAQEHLRVRAASLSEVEHLRMFWDMTDHRQIRDVMG